MTSEQAKKVKRKGKLDEIDFANLIGVGEEYQNGPTDKKDVIDQNGDTHSVKGGDKRWQIFLYGQTRFENDPIFKVMGGVGDGVGDLILSCFSCFPDKYIEYQTNKKRCKEALKSKMLALTGKLQNKDVFSAFLLKSMFNGGEVVYLTVKRNDKFHVFYYSDVIDVLVNHLQVQTSVARAKGQMNYQKVTILHCDKNVGTIEMRHDSKAHYKQAVFSLDKDPILAILISKISEHKEWGDRVSVYGRALKKFAKCHKAFLKSH